MQTEELRLDGNAAAGILYDVFAREMTMVHVSCNGCKQQGPIGALLEYGHGMGVVLRCPACDTLVLRIAFSRGLSCVDLAGTLLPTVPS